MSSESPASTTANLSKGRWRRNVLRVPAPHPIPLRAIGAAALGMPARGVTLEDLRFLAHLSLGTPLPGGGKSLRSALKPGGSTPLRPLARYGRPTKTRRAEG